MSPLHLDRYIGDHCEPPVAGRCSGRVGHGGDDGGRTLYFRDKRLPNHAGRRQSATRGF